MSSKWLSFWGRKVLTSFLINSWFRYLTMSWLSFPICDSQEGSHDTLGATVIVPCIAVPDVLDSPLEGGQGRLGFPTGWSVFMSHLPLLLRMLRSTTVLWRSASFFQTSLNLEKPGFTVILMDLWNMQANHDGASPGCALGLLPFPSNPDTQLRSGEVLNFKTCRQSRIAAIAKL